LEIPPRGGPWRGACELLKELLTELPVLLRKLPLEPQKKLLLLLQDKLLLLLKLLQLQLEILRGSHSENVVERELKPRCVGVRLRYLKNANNDIGSLK
jgi:hypothetical protein